MATKIQIQNLLNEIQIPFDIDEFGVLLNSDGVNIYEQIEFKGRIDEMLLKYAKYVDLKKVLLFSVSKYKDRQEEYEKQSKYLGDMNGQQLKKAMKMAKSIITPKEEIIMAEDDFNGKGKLISSSEILYNKSLRTENKKWDKVKEYIPIDMMLVWEVEQVVDIELARYLISIMMTPEQKRLIIEEHPIQAKDIAERFRDNRELIAEIREVLEKTKRYIDVDKLVLLKCEEAEKSIELDIKLEENYIRFLEKLPEILPIVNPKARVYQIGLTEGKKKIYTLQDAKSMLARMDLEKNFLYTKEGIESGEVLLEKIPNYVDMLSEKELQKLAEISEQNLLYLALRKKISMNVIKNIEAKKGISIQGLTTLYKQKSISVEWYVQKYMKKATQEEIGEFILRTIKESPNEVWEEIKKRDIKQRILEMYLNGDINLDIMKKAFSDKEIAEIVTEEEIVELYKQIYIKGQTGKKEEYDKKIELYQLTGKQHTDSIIFLLEDELDDDMLINLYQDGLITAKIILEYGEKELLQKIIDNGSIKERDAEEIKQAYIIGKIELDMIIQAKKQLGEELLNIVNEIELAKAYGQVKKEENEQDIIKYKRYRLLYQNLKREKDIDERFLQTLGEYNEQDIHKLYVDGIIGINTVKECSNDILEQIIIQGELRPIDAKGLYSGEEEINKVEEILKREQMDDLQKMILIYSTFEDDKETRDRLVRYLNAHASEPKNKEKLTQSQAKLNEETNNNKKRGIPTDPYSRWKLFSVLDPQYTQKYIDGYLIVSLGRINKTIVEKLFQKEKGKVVPAYGTATFIMGTDKYLEMEDKLTQNERFQIKFLRQVAKVSENGIVKCTHHPAKNGKMQGAWGNKLLSLLLGKSVKEVYSSQDMEEIEKYVEEIEKSRVHEMLI